MAPSGSWQRSRQYSSSFSELLAGYQPARLQVPAPAAPAEMPGRGMEKVEEKGLRTHADPLPLLTVPASSVMLGNLFNLSELQLLI